MTTQNSPASPPPRKNLWRALRPLILWGIVFLAIIGYAGHKNLLERTRINFSIQPPDNNPMYLASAWLDGQPVTSGQKISLGSHTFKVTHPRGETFEATFFGWYGGKDFGTVALKRSTGTLNIHAKRTILVLSVSGRDFSTVLTNITEKSLTVPTDDYMVTASFPNRPADTQKISVVAGQVGECSFAPAYGALHASANRDEVTFELTDSDGQTVKNGNLPVTSADLPVGTYRLSATWHSHQVDNQVVVKKDQTTEVPFEFVYGSAVVLSTPDGASVYNANGNYLGVTPLLVKELNPGNTEFKLQLNSHQDAIVSVLVSADQTNTASTNMLSWAYVNGLQSARHDMEMGNYRAALNDLQAALQDRPGDAEALALQAQAKARLPIQTAKELAGQGDYVGADKLLHAALTTLPDDGEVKKLLADYQPREANQIGEQQEQQTRAVFEADCQKLAVARFFEPHEFVTAKKSPDDFKNELVRLYTDEAPKAKVTVDRMPQPGVHEILFEQSSPNPLEMARREMLVVIGKGKTGQTLVLFKNFEYQRRMNGNTLNIVIGGSMADNWVPLHSSQVQMTPAYEEQIKVGYRMMMRKVMKAVGETFVYTPN